jgi:hypothetical protein
MNRLITHLLIATSLLIAGCSTTLPVNYIASSSIRGNTTVALGNFKYIPAEQGAVNPNEFQKATAALGQIYLSEPVSDLIRNAMRKELIMSGFTVEPESKLIIEADIKRFLYDWIGFVEVDFYLDATFRILREKELLLTYEASSHQKAPKTMIHDTEAIRAAISKCFDDFFLAARLKKVF